MAESTPATKPPRAPAVAHGFDIMLGTAEDVAKAGELGAFAGLKTKSELEKEFTAWIAAQPANLVADFLAHLKRRAPSRGLDIDGYPDDRAAIQALLLYRIDWANQRKRLDEIDALLKSIAEDELIELEEDTATDGEDEEPGTDCRLE